MTEHTFLLDVLKSFFQEKAVNFVPQFPEGTRNKMGHNVSFPNIYIKSLSF